MPPDRASKGGVLLLRKASNATEVNNILILNRELDLGIDKPDEDKKIPLNEINIYGQTAFNELIERGILDGAEHLLETFGKELDVSKPDIQGVTPLQGAVKQKDIGLAEAIIKIFIEQRKANLINTVNNAQEETFTLMA